MRRFFAVSIILVACNPTTNATGIEPAEGEPHVFVSNGNMVTPLQNGGRVKLTNGWARLTFTPYPPRARSDLDVQVFYGDSGEPTIAEVSVAYEMIGMEEHGVVIQRAIPRANDHYILPLNVGMPGFWRFSLKVVFGGTMSTFVLLIPVPEGR